MTELDERALQGKRLKVRPLTTRERDELQALDRKRAEAARAFDRQIIHLYLVGCSQASIAQALGVRKQAVGLMISRRRKWFTEEVIPRRRPGTPNPNGTRTR